MGKELVEKSPVLDGDGIPGWLPKDHQRSLLDIDSRAPAAELLTPWAWGRTRNQCFPNAS